MTTSQLTQAQLDQSRRLDSSTLANAIEVFDVRLRNTGFTDSWNHILSIPAPRIVVVEDVAEHPGLGSFIGEVHANILYILGCVGIVTNGAVRSLRATRAIRFQMFAGNLFVSHAHAHIFDFGGTVTVAGMKVQAGDLLHGDVHGVQTIPLEITDNILNAAEQIARSRERVVALCRSQEFTLDKIRAAVKDWKPRRGNFRTEGFALQIG